VVGQVVVALKLIIRNTKDRNVLKLPTGEKFAQDFFTGK
jgi:hypothetical protein